MLVHLFMHHWLLLICALAGHQTCILVVSRRCSAQLSYPARVQLGVLKISISSRPKPTWLHLLLCTLGHVSLSFSPPPVSLTSSPLSSYLNNSLFYQVSTLCHVLSPVTLTKSLCDWSPFYRWRNRDTKREGAHPGPHSQRQASRLQAWPDLSCAPSWVRC